MFTLSNRAIKDLTDYKSYIRGQSYFEQERILDLEIADYTDTSLHLATQVKGSARRIYRQYIVAKKLASNETIIAAQCSCPVGYNCKHVVAACLFFSATYPDINEPSDPKDASLSWLSEFIEAGPSNQALGENRKDFLAYILKASTEPTTLSVSIVVSRQLVSGKFSKGRRIKLDKICEKYNYSPISNTEDRAIGALINGLDLTDWRQEDSLLKGELGQLALSKILLTGRSFWKSTQSAPMKFGDPREALLEWKEKPDGDRQLTVQLNPSATLLNTTPPLYLDLESSLIGPVEGITFSEKQWEMLMNAPSLPANMSEKFSRQLLTKAPDLQLPTPNKLETHTINNELPIPNLRLLSTTHSITAPYSPHPTHALNLFFSYADFNIMSSPRRPVENLLLDDKRIVIQRNLDLEDKAVHRLSEIGFESLTDQNTGNPYFTPTQNDHAPNRPNTLESAHQWHDFMVNQRPKLEAEGWNIIIDPSFDLQFLQADQWDVEVESDNDWFDLRFDLEIDGKKFQLLPLISQILNDYDLDNLPQTIIVPLQHNQFLPLPVERIRPIFQILYELFDADSLDDNGRIRLNRFDAARLAELEEHSELHWRGGKAMRNLGRKLKNFDGIRKVATPRGLKAQLRDYQQQGLNWLQFLRSYQFNGILADDMGLGKTVQTLAHLLLEKERKRMETPCLIIAPTSLMGNWRREAEQFTPKLSVLILQGPDRKRLFSKIDQYDLILTTYPLLVRDQETFLAKDFHYLILDEAQVIKNPKSKSARVAREIKANHRLCLTGTPMENHLGELWALFDFLMPGFLGQSKLFRQQFRIPIEKHGDNERGLRLSNRVAPFMLRRTKAAVAKELPNKIEMVRSVVLDPKQASLYESIRLAMENKVKDAIAHKGLARSHIMILDALLKLRQTCCDPRLLSLEHAKNIKQSAKLDMLMEMLPELLEEGRRILIFSQFTKMLRIIEDELCKLNISYCKLTGQTRQRDAVIDRFRNGEADVFLISLKAGGVGLNLTEADTVIHYDPWWNPAVENQATDRAHRIGQDKTVFVYKLITENTLEEKIMAMQTKKQALADGVYSKGKKNADAALTAEDLQSLFSPL